MEAVSEVAGVSLDEDTHKDLVDMTSLHSSLVFIDSFPEESEAA